jgi:archaellum component FlaC
MTMTRVAAKVYELQSQDRDRIALVPGMQIVTFLPHGSSQPSSPSGRLLVSGVRKDGSPGDLDCFGFVVDSDLAPLVIPEQDGWPARTLSTSNNRDDMGILEETRMNGTSVSIPPVTYFQNGSEESERLKQRLMQLDQRKGDILAELESMPIIEGRIKAFETILAQLEQEIEGIKLEQQEMGSHLAPLSERMKALVMIQSPMEQELAHLRAEAYDNLGALFKLRYLLSRERHRAIDVAFQAEAKGQEADKLEVLEKRLDLLGSEQQEILRVKFNEQMLALQRKAQAEMQNLAELEPLADTLLARYAKIDNDGSALKTALEKENEKLEKIQAKIEAVETEIEANIATREVFEGIIADKHKDEHGDPFAPLVRWIRGDSRTSGPTPAPASAPVGGVVPLTPLSGSPMSPFPPSAPLASAATGSVSSVPGEAAPWPGAPPAPMPAPYHVAAPVAPAVASGDRGSSDAGADWWDAGTVPSHTEISAPATVRLRMGSVGEPVAFPPRTAASADPTASAASAGSAISTASSGGDALARLRIAAADIEVNYERKLGEGGFGIVYEGLLKGATKVAIKTIKGDVSARTAAVFLKEVAVWNGLNQRNGEYHRQEDFS